MSRAILFPYKMASESAKALRDKLEEMGMKTRRVFASGKYKPFRGHIILNWGNHVAPSWYEAALRLGLVILNKPEAVAISRDKRLAFVKFHEAGVSCPAFTTNVNQAQEWADEQPVMQYMSATAQGGSGVTYAIAKVQLSEGAQLWTKYIKKAQEFRVHVMRGNVIDVQQKKGRQGFEGERNFKIRNLAGGWVYAREDIVVPDGVREEAIKAVAACGLDFGAVDVIYNKNKAKAYVLEINSAPGLEGTTVTNYAGSILAVKE